MNPYSINNSFLQNKPRQKCMIVIKVLLGQSSPQKHKKNSGDSPLKANTAYWPPCKIIAKNILAQKSLFVEQLIYVGVLKKFCGFSQYFFHIHILQYLDLLHLNLAFAKVGTYVINRNILNWFLKEILSGHPIQKSNPKTL